MKVTNMTSPNGNEVANQFIVENVAYGINRIGEDEYGTFFQSYNSVIAFVTNCGDVYLDRGTWNFSRTTSKYRSQFLGETTKETQAKIDSGEYILADLN